MIKFRFSDDPIDEDEDDEHKDLEVRAKYRCKIFLGYTSNVVSCGMREYIKYLCQHKIIDCIVKTCSGIEEDYIKCLASIFIGDFNLDGNTLRQRGVNRIGNILMPNKNYELLEE